MAPSVAMITHCFCVLLAVVDSSSVQRQRVSPLPKRLVRQQRTPAETILEPIDIALVSSDFEGLQRVIEDRANPDSPRYAQWLSTAAVTQYVRASEQAIEEVAAWIRSAHLEPELNNHMDYLTIKNAPAWKVEQLLSAELHSHYDTVSQRIVHRVPGNYSIPAHLDKHISKIFPVHSVPVTSATLPQRKRLAESIGSASNGSWPSDCAGLPKQSGELKYAITPAVTREVYDYEVAGCSKNSSVAALLSGPVGVLLDDIPTMQKACGLPSKPLDKYQGKNDVSKCQGVHPSEDECMESTIDVQIITTAATECHTEFWSAGADSSFINLFKGISAAGDAAPRVFSFSFGDPETERDDDVKDTDKEFAKIVATGITLVSASGDNGAGKKLFKYVTNYPASSPYVLSVGSTSLKTDGDVRSTEVAVKDGFSSGGFSSVFAAPAWQASFTKAYLASGAKHPASGFDKAGRGVPDISALGADWALIWRGPNTEANGVPWSDADGTSTSSPFIASLIARLNAARFAHGQGSMGYMNPWLYRTVSSKQDALHDVIEGSNNANGESGEGFSAVKGWDPVTGLGTPNFKILQALALSRPETVVV